MSQLKDTWRGLVQRRLWPVALLLLAALAAVPAVLARDPEPVAATPAPVAAQPAELTTPIVSPAEAGVREKGRRVVGARKNPFQPVPTPEPAEPAAPAAGAPKAATAAATGTGGSGTPDAAGTASSSGGSSPVLDVAPAVPAPVSIPKPQREIRPESDDEDAKPLPFYSVTVRWGKITREKLGARDMKRLQVLPNATAPLVQFLGVLEDGETAVFVVGKGVSTRGDAACEPAEHKCGTLELQEGDRQEFAVVAEDGTITAHYVLDLVLIRKQKTGEVTRASTEAKAARTALTARAARVAPYAFDAERGILELRSAA